MGVCYRDARLQDELNRLLDGQGSSLLQPRRQIPALEELHHHVRSTVIESADVEDPGYVLVLDLNSCSCLAGESRDGFRAGDQLGKQKLESHPTVELDVASRDDDAHAPYTEDTLDAVLATEHVALPNTRC
jgi:hypothetical protein